MTDSDESPRLSVTMGSKSDFESIRFEVLKDELSMLKVQMALVLSRQDDIVRLLTERTTVPAIESSPRTSGTSETKLKPATPNDFDGERTKGWAFLNSCNLYISLVPHQFPDKEKTVHWAISYMKTGCAALFTQRVIRYQATYKKPRFAT